MISNDDDGVLTIKVPETATCEFQVDVKVASGCAQSPRDFVWYAGIVAKV